MSKLDEAKEQISLMKFWLGALVGVAIALGAWVAQNYKLNDFDTMFILAHIALIAVAITILILSKILNKKIRKLRDL